jgi:hypothetical protein
VVVVMVSCGHHIEFGLTQFANVHGHPICLPLRTILSVWARGILRAATWRCDFNHRATRNGVGPLLGPRSLGRRHGAGTEQRQGELSPLQGTSHQKGPPLTQRGRRAHHAPILSHPMDSSVLALP